MILLSRSITSGPRWGKTNASTGNDLLPSFSLKRTYPRIWRGEPSALRSDIAPGGIGKMHFCLNFSCLSMNVFDMHGISVAESIVSWCSILSSSRTPRIRTLVDGKRVG